MDVLMPILIIIILIALVVLIWSLHKLYKCAKDSTKKKIDIIFLVTVAIVVFLFYLFASPDEEVFEKATNRAVIGFMKGFICVFIIYLPHLIKRTKNYIRSRINKSKLTPFKIEIVNDEKYIKLEQKDRINFLKKLKEQAVDELSKQQKKLEKETNKLKDIPADVAKYVKPTDTTALKKGIENLERKIEAIDDLIESENK